MVDTTVIADALRLAIGTLSTWRVKPPTRIDAQVAGWAMTLAPLAVLPLAALCALALLAMSWAGCNSNVCAAVILAGMALSSRGMHLDGVADLADGLCAGFDRERSLAVMKQSDTGAGGVAAMSLLLLVQFSALSSILTQPRLGAALLVLAVLAARHALAWACRRGVPAATQSGLGATVAATVSPPLLGSATAVMVGGGTLAGCAFLALFTESSARWLDIALVVIVIITVVAVATHVVIGIAVRRLGGITGDVLGATVEISFAAALVAAAAIGAQVSV